MFHRLRTHLNPASLIAMVALFVALGGVSYAAATIGSKEIKNNSIRSVDVRNGGLTGKDLRKDSVGGAKIKESTLGQVPSAQQAQDAVNAESATNAQNAVKAQSADNAVNAESATSAQTAAAVGPNGVGTGALQSGSVSASKLAATTRRSTAVSVAAGGTQLVTAGCQPGERMLSGGGVWSGGIGAAAANLHVVHSFPTAGGTWSVRVYNGTAAARDFTAYAHCLTN